MLRHTLAFSLIMSSAVASAQLQFTEYVGEIKASVPIALAGDNFGNLYYSTYNYTGVTEAEIRVIEDPLEQIGEPTENSRVIHNFRGSGTQGIINGVSRGIQQMVFASDNTLFAAGDNTQAGHSNIWKFNYTPDTPTSFTHDSAFRTLIQAQRPARRSGVAIVNEGGAGLLVTNGFLSAESVIDYFNFDGTPVGTRITDTLYHRHIHYLPAHNVAYPVRNGGGATSQHLINKALTGINTTTGGGSLIDAALVMDGGTDNSTGHSIQGSYYLAEQDQFIIVDAKRSSNNPRVRVFDVENDGLSLELAYTITGTEEEQPFGALNGVTVIDNHLFFAVPGSNTIETSKIYVFRDPSASVENWRDF